MKSITKIVSHVRFQLREFKTGANFGKKWSKATATGASAAYFNLRSLIRTKSDYLRLIAKPLSSITAKWLSDKAVTRSGLHKRDCLASQKAKLNKSASKYFQHLKRVYTEGNGIPYSHRVIRAEQTYAQNAGRYLLPFTGHHRLGKGLGPLAAGWLTGQETIRDFMVPADKIIAGGPVLITSAKRAGRFRKDLINRIIHAGSRILHALQVEKYIREDLQKGLHPPPDLIGFMNNVIFYENRKLNQLINRYAGNWVKTFATGGQSHIDFHYEESGKGFYLEVKVTQK